MMRKKQVMVFTAMLMSLALAGCGGQTSVDSSQGGSKNGAQSAQNESENAGAGDAGSASENEKTMRVAFFWISADLDPANDYNGWVTSRLGVGETLVRLNDELKIEPCLADEWENVDELTWKFHIREGAMFSNGTPVTAQACQASLERAISMNDRASEYLKVESMEADGQELTIRTSEPNAGLLSNLVEPVFDIVDATQSEDQIKTAPVGTGPYKIANFQSEQSAELVKNENYWDGEPGLDRIEVTQIADSDARAMALQSGEIDLTNTIDQTSTTLFENNPDYQVSSIISPRVNVAYMNHAESSPLHDVELRKAISYAVNREAYAELIGGSPAHGLYSDATPFGNETIWSFPYDKDQAEQILDEAGYRDVDGDGIREMTDGSQMTLHYLQAADHGSADSAILAQAVQSDLKAVGIDMEILSVENLSEYQSQGNFDFYTGNDNSAPTGDPQLWLETMYTGLGVSGKKNLTSFQDDKIDEIVAQMNQTFDQEERYQLASEASEELNETASNLYLTNSYLNMVSSARVKQAVQPVADYYFITKDITIEE